MRKSIVILVIWLALAPLSPVLAEVILPPSNLLIVEVQTGQVGATGNDFVKVYNPSEVEVDVTGWRLQYRSATNIQDSGWSTKRTISCISGPADCHIFLPASGFMVIATYDITGVDEQLITATGFADNGGQLRLVLPAAESANPGFQQDMVGYGTALVAEGQAAPAPSPSESLKRRVDLTGNFVDTNNNLGDFTRLCGLPSPEVTVLPLAGTPEGCPVYELPPEPEPTDTPPADEPPSIPPTEPDLPPEPEPSEPLPPSPPEPTPVPPAEEPPVPPPQEPSPPPEPPPVEVPGPNEPPSLPPETPPSQPQLVLSEVLPDPIAPQQDVLDEFVEIYNPGDQPVDLADYKLQTGSSFQNVVTISGGIVAAGGYVLVKSADSSLSLVNSGTAIRLLSPDGSLLDEMPNYQVAVAGESWIESAGVWQWTTTPTPGAENLLTLPAPPPEEPTETTPPANEEPSPETPAPTPGQGSGPISYAPVVVTELLPDPVSPELDSNDEFIELFNPGNQAFSLKDYQIQTGSDFRYKFVLPDVVINPGQFIALKSEETNLSLSNTGTAVRVLDPNGQVLDEVANYGKAEAGQSWMRLADGSWQWTSTPTPNAANHLTIKPKIVKASSKKTAKASKAKKSTAKVASARAYEVEGQPLLGEDSPSSPNYWLLAGVGSLVAGYGLYEYRQDLGRGLRKAWQVISRSKSDE